MSETKFTPILEFKSPKKSVIPPGYATRPPSVEDIKTARKLMLSVHGGHKLNTMEHDFISHVEAWDIIGVLLARIDELEHPQPPKRGA